VVLIAGQNDDEILDFAAFARSTGRSVRFIELMPLDAGDHWDRSQVVPGREVLAAVAARWPLEPVPDADPTAPATTFRFTDGRGEIGLISSVTEPFCGTCDRLRITADGAVRNCLFSDDETSLRSILRSGGTDDDLGAAVRRAVWAKRPGHGIDDPSLLLARHPDPGTGFQRTTRSMSAIGG